MMSPNPAWIGVHLFFMSVLSFSMDVLVPRLLHAMLARLPSFPGYVGLIGDLSFWITPVLALAAGFGLSRRYFTALHMEHPARKAAIATTLGTLMAGLYLFALLIWFFVELSRA